MYSHSAGLNGKDRIVAVNVGVELVNMSGNEWSMTQSAGSVMA